MCVLHKQHGSAEPLAEEVHHIWPRAMGGPDIKENRVSICPTGHTNVHRLIHLLLHDLPLPTGHRHEQTMARLGVGHWEAAGKPGKPE